MSEQGNFYTDPSRPGRGFCLLIRDGKPFAGTWYDYDRDGNQCWLTLDPPNEQGRHVLRRPRGNGFSAKGPFSYEGTGPEVGWVSFSEDGPGKFLASYTVDRVKLEGARLDFSPPPPQFYSDVLSLVPVVS